MSVYNETIVSIDSHTPLIPGYGGGGMDEGGFGACVYGGLGIPEISILD